MQLPQNIPYYVPFTFILTTILTLILVYWVIKKSNNDNISSQAIKITAGLLIWIVIQFILTSQGIYNTNTDALPPRIVLFGILPVVIVILISFNTKKGKIFIDSLSLQNLTFIHLVRIPVEIVLYWLAIRKAIPEVMTFAGNNFDILAGITAPLIIYFGFMQKQLGKYFILTWNVLCLGLLINIIVHAFLTAPSPFQQMAFDQPNIAILNFPYSWLPTFIVPMVIFAHLITIRQLVLKKYDKNIIHN